jgi:hypothetical protein
MQFSNHKPFALAAMVAAAEITMRQRMQRCYHMGGFNWSVLRLAKATNNTTLDSTEKPTDLPIAVLIIDGVE